MHFLHKKSNGPTRSVRFIMNIMPIIQPIAGIFGMVGGILGIISWSRMRTLQRYQIEEFESKKQKRLEEDQVFEYLIKDAGDHVVSRWWQPEVGSETFKVMERLVERGKLERNEFGNFMIANNRRDD